MYDFQGEGMMTPSKPPPPTNNFCLYPRFKMSFERSLNDPHHPTLSIFHYYPPSTTPGFPPPPKKNLITQLLVDFITFLCTYAGHINLIHNHPPVDPQGFGLKICPHPGTFASKLLPWWGWSLGHLRRAGHLSINNV